MVWSVKRHSAVQKCVLRQLDLWDKRREMARELSGGMKRRLMIARALAHQPKLLILDEPTAGVDVEIRHAMWDLLREINRQGTTIILTTHYLEEAERMCRHIGIINHGEIIENTSLPQFLSKLSMESYELNLRESLSDFPDQTVDDFILRRLDDFTLEVDVSKGQSINSLFSLLSKRGIEVVGMRSAQNRLEQLFMDVISGSRREADK